MPSYTHRKLIEEILRLDTPPVDANDFSLWIKAGQHLKFLEETAKQDEIVVYGSGPYSFIHSIVVPNEALSPPDCNDLLKWSCNPYRSIASYVSGGGREGMWIERGISYVGSDTLEKGTNLIFGRTFEGWSEDDRYYFEVNQEYTHLAGIHWRPEEGAYCHYNDHGDLAHAVSVSTKSLSGNITRDCKVFGA